MPKNEGMGRNVVLVVGSGVAGLVAAITSAQKGLHPILFERAEAPPVRPGETFHPGIEPIFNLLGLKECLSRIATARPRGIALKTNYDFQRIPYGGSSSDPWRGYQVCRSKLTQTLVEKARLLEVDIRFGQSVKSIVSGRKGCVSIETSAGTVHGHWIVDATGLSNWSARKGRSSYKQASPKKLLSYGYDITSANEDLDWPTFIFEQWGWRYRAPLGDGRTSWVNLYDTREAFDRLIQPDAKVLDGTWRICSEPAVDQLYRVGDCACMIDPSSGKGVLRAMMTAMMAIHSIDHVVCNKVSLQVAAKQYSMWITNWFDADVAELQKLNMSRSN